MARTRRQQESEPPEEEAEVAHGREHGVSRHRSGASMGCSCCQQRLRNARLMVAVSPRF